MKQKNRLTLWVMAALKAIVCFFTGVSLGATEYLISHGMSSPTLKHDIFLLVVIALLTSTLVWGVPNVRLSQWPAKAEKGNG